MNCLILTNKTGVSFHFNEIVADGVIELMYENSGLKFKVPFSNTDFLRISSLMFEHRGNVEIKVISDNKLVKKKIINSYT